MVTDPKPSTTWGAGDYPLMAQRLEPVARELVEKAGVAGEDRVLDLGCGTGTAALIAAARGAHVVGVDFEPALLDIAEHQARSRSADVQWVLADLVSAPVPDGAFSVVISAFGAMYAADADQAAAAISRYSAAGARIALSAWTPGSFMPGMGATLAWYLPPPPPGSSPPSRWGDAAAVSHLLAQHGLTTTRTETSSLPLAFTDPATAVDFLIRTAGHVLAERPRLEETGKWADLRRDLIQFVITNNTASAHASDVEVRLDYLTLIAHREPR